MDPVRQATAEDLARIAEIEVFSYRLLFYPIFRDDGFYFGELQVPRLMEDYRRSVGTFLVYDDGVVKGFIRVEKGEILKLFVEPVLRGRSIGSALIRRAVAECGADRLWVLEGNEPAIAFYEKHGFTMTGERRPEEGTDAFLLRMRKAVRPE